MRTLSILFAFLLFASCQRPSQQRIVKEYVGPLKYQFNQFLYKNTYYDSAKARLGCYITYVSGNPYDDTLTCYLSNLPSGITCEQDTIMYPVVELANGFAFQLDIARGVYRTDTIVLNVINKSYGHVQFPMIVETIPPYNYASELIGDYTSNDPCGYYSIGSYWSGKYSSHIDVLPGAHGWISIPNLRGLGDTIVVKAFLGDTRGNLNNNTIYIPRQIVLGYNISGSGHYSNQQLLFKDTIIHDGHLETCMCQLKRP